MAFTLITVTATYKNADQSPATGYVSFQATAEMQQTGGNIQPATLTRVALDPTGKISVVLPATDDPATLPVGVTYTVTEQIAGAPTRIWQLIVPRATTPLDLSTAIPATVTPSSVGHVSSLTVDGAATFTAGPLSFPAGSIAAAAIAGGLGVPSIAGTANQIAQAGSPGAVTLSLPANGTLPGAWHAATGFTIDAGGLTIAGGNLTQGGGALAVGQIRHSLATGVADHGFIAKQNSGGTDAAYAAFGVLNFAENTWLARINKDGSTTFGGGNTAFTAAGDASTNRGIAVWGHATVGAQPAAPVTLADVIAIIRGCGLSA